VQTEIDLVAEHYFCVHSLHHEAFANEGLNESKLDGGQLVSAPQIVADVSGVLVERGDGTASTIQPVACDQLGLVRLVRGAVLVLLLGLEVEDGGILSRSGNLLLRREGVLGTLLGHPDDTPGDPTDSQDLIQN
jgi:hypothetical protein